jgi:hypothetical protein
MPAYFSFYDPAFHRLFYGQLLSSRCRFMKKNQQQCKHSCVRPFEYCYAHLPMALNLQVRDSLIAGAGKGLFVKAEGRGENDIIFRKGQTICQYNGQHLTPLQLYQRYHQFYGARVSQWEAIDGSLERGVGSFANIFPNHQNAYLSPSPQHHSITLKANKNIRNNQEIYVPYSTGYHLPEQEGIHYYTKNWATKY